MRFTWLRDGATLPPGRYAIANVVVPLVGTVSTITITNANMSDVCSYAVTVANGVGSVTSSAAVVTLSVPPVTVTLPALLPATSKMLTNGFRLQFSVATGSNYVVEASTNLLTWTPVYTNVSSTGTASWTDTAALLIPRRYYRVHY